MADEISVKEAAFIARRHVVHIHKLIAAGVIRSRKARGHRRVSAASVQKYIDTRGQLDAALVRERARLSRKVLKEFQTARYDAQLAFKRMDRPA